MSLEYITVHKNSGESLGLGFNKNSEKQNKVYAILEGTALQRSKQVAPGDLVVQINGEDVQNYNSSQLIDLISTLQDDTVVTLQVLHNKPTTNGSDMSPTIVIDSVPSVEVSKPRGRLRKMPVVPSSSKDSLPKINETEEMNKSTVHLQPKESHLVSKRLSLTPETKHRQVAPLQPSKSLDLGALPNWRSKKGAGFIGLQNYWTNEQFTDRLHTQPNQIKATGCQATHCVGSQIWPKDHPRSRPYGPPRPKDQMKEKAAEYLNMYYDAQKQAIGADYEQMLKMRLQKVNSEIDAKGHYDLTYEELVFGARLAWRNAPRCVNRIVWRQLEVLDARDVNSAKEMFEAICDHLRYATNGGNLRSTITIFRHRTKANSDFRVWNVQLIRYAGYKQSDGSIMGDPDSVEFTDVCRKLGWSPPNKVPGQFDVLPLVLQANGGNPELFVIPNDLAMQVDIVHPEYKWFKDFKLKWYAVPAVSGMLLDVGGLEFTACPFNGWYMSSEIASRNFGDEYRYNLLKPIAEKLGMNTSTQKLWKDRAMVEMNVAVLHSYQSAGVSIVDHHSATESFMTFFKSESVTRGGCPADWVWLVPPISGSATKVFHQEMLLYYLTPSYEYQEPPYKYYHLPGEMPRLAPHKTFKTVASMVLDATRLMRNVKQRRIKATVLYATETGRSRNYANIVKNLFDRSFNCTIYCMDDYNRANIEMEQLMLVVTSTFGSGEPPANGEGFGRYLMDMNAKRLAGPSLISQKRNHRVSVISRPTAEMLAKAKQEMPLPLSQVKYAVFGLGSRAYPSFCAFAHTVDNMFMTLGAEQIYPCGEGDELCGQEESFQSWLRECYLSACEAYKIQSRLEDDEFTPGKFEYKKDSYRIVPYRDAVPTKDLCRDLSHVHNKKVYVATLKSRTKLQSPQSDRSTILLKFKPQNHILYQPGDHIAIYPQNHPVLVRDLLERLTLPCAIDDPFIIESEYTNQNGTNSWMKERRLPIPVTLIEAFTNYLDITTPPTPQLLQLYQAMATRKVDQEHLSILSMGGHEYEDWKYERFPNLLEVINQFPSLKLNVPFLLQHLPLLQCRYYSISSSPRSYPDEIHATVAVVTFRKPHSLGLRHYGVCSTWLNRMEMGSIVPFVMRKANTFHLPEDVNTPIIMVGPGTGIAPFRGFWQERVHLHNEALKKQLLSATTPMTQQAGPRRIPRGGTAQIPNTPANKISIGSGRRIVSTVTAPLLKLLDVETKPPQAPVSDLSDTESEDESEDEQEKKKKETPKKPLKRPLMTPQATNTPRILGIRRSASDEFASKGDFSELVAARSKNQGGKMTLYFGCRRSDMDYIYRDEIQKAQITGALTNVHVAFSREPSLQKTYVQHLLKENADSIVQQLIEERGHFYVCGDVSMAADVGRTLQNIFEENAAMSSDEARQLIESMKDNGYYHEDIFGVTLKTAEVTNRVRTAAKKAWRILVSAADNNALTPLSGRPPITPTTPFINQPETPMESGGTLRGTRLPKRPTVTVLIPTTSNTNDPVSPISRMGTSQPHGPDILGGSKSQPSLTAKYRQGRRQPMGGLGPVKQDLDEPEMNILGGHSPHPSPTLSKRNVVDSSPVKMRESTEDSQQRRAIRKIRSNSLVQTDV